MARLKLFVCIFFLLQGQWPVTEVWNWFYQFWNVKRTVILWSHVLAAPLWFCWFRRNRFNLQNRLFNPSFPPGWSLCFQTQLSDNPRFSVKTCSSERDFSFYTFCCISKKCVCVYINVCSCTWNILSKVRTFWLVLKGLFEGWGQNWIQVRVMVRVRGQGSG